MYRVDMHYIMHVVGLNPKSWGYKGKAFGEAAFGRRKEPFMSHFIPSWNLQKHSFFYCSSILLHILFDKNNKVLLLYGWWRRNNEIDQ